VGAIADGAEAIECGDAQCGGEIAVGATPDGAFTKRKTHLRGERFGASEKSCAHSAFEWGAIEAAGDFQASAPVDRAESVQAALQDAHVGNAHRAQIKNGSGVFGDDVGARAAFDDAGIDGYTPAKIVPFFEARELRRNFVDGVNSFLGRETCVRGAAVHCQFGLADSFARRF
jgi:hypothetical protein